MTDKQPEALRLADYWDGRAKELQPWIDDNEFTEFGYRPEGLKREQESFKQAAAELRRLYEVNAGLVEALSVVIRGVPDTWEGVQKAKEVLDKAKEQNNE